MAKKTTKQSKSKLKKIVEERLYYPSFFHDFGPGEKPGEALKNRKKRRKTPYKPARHNIA